jgi:predicted dehydrogenase
MSSGSDQTLHAGPIRLGMVGGGQGAFIGAVHRLAARMDGHYVLTAGALSSDPERAKLSAQELGLSPDRAYSSFEEMARVEAAREDGIEAVAIVTPNHMHFPVAKAFLEAGIHVICDKPLTSTLTDAEALAKLSRTSGKLFAVTYNYTGYPLIRQAREMIARGDIGQIRVVQCEYAQDWLTENLEGTGQKQAAWRTDPTRSGAGGAIGDIGSHAFNLVHFVSGLHLDRLAADLESFGEGRTLDDNAHIMLRFKGGGKGMMWCSQVAPGNENALRLRIYGDKGGLEWEQENPNKLWFTPFGQEKRLITRGGAGALPHAARLTRIPAGHPEGYLEGFANIYGEIASAILARRSASNEVPPEVTFPTIEDGLEGMQFIDACVRSSTQNSAWTSFS